jgi:hypothetical protein
MNRKRAIIEILNIRTGHGLSKEDYPEKWKGSIAKDNWNNDLFNYGFEYGYIFGLMKAYNINPDEVRL